MSGSYTFEDDAFTNVFFSDGGVPPLTSKTGHYRVDDESIFLSFDDPLTPSRKFYFLTLDSVHLIALNRLDLSRHAADFDFYVLAPPNANHDDKWWEKLLNSNPNFRKAVQGGSDASR